jgi:hypothetical protein
LEIRKRKGKQWGKKSKQPEGIKIIKYGQYSIMLKLRRTRGALVIVGQYLPKWITTARVRIYGKLKKKEPHPLTTDQMYGVIEI